MAPVTSLRAGRATDRRSHPPSRRGRARILIPLLIAMTMLLSLVSVAAPAEAATTRRTATELEYGRAVLRVLNNERRAHNLPIVRMDQRLRLAARWHNLAMASRNTLSHQLPGEPNFAQRITRAGYHWTYAGENIGWTSSISRRGVVALQRIMYNEKPPNDGHRLNILNRKYRDVGVDVYIDRRHHKVWLTTDFGRH